MDVSSEYVKMCGKAEEIQALKARSPLNWGGWLNSKASETWSHEWVADRGVHIACPNDFGSPIYPSSIWLPRQDQLQEMIPPEPIKNPHPVFWDWWNALDGYVHGMQYPLGLTSMEQLWLACVMKKKYGEEWNGKDWVKA